MPDQTLQEIKDRLNIADVLGSYIQMKKAGTNYKAVCPFHSEKSASLMVSPQKQIWHCFGCGEGGDIFGFVMRYENVEFRDAIKLLAEKAGVKLPEYKPGDKKTEDERERLLRINSFAARFYHETLLKDKAAQPARDYLHKRGLTAETIQQWQIGFAPDSFHALEQALVKKQASLADMVAAGVSVKNERGQMYDRFRARVTFPIFNYLGDVVGFSARILTADVQQAKYINSPETPVYNKSKVLFGLNFAKNDIRKQDEVIIVEGQMDCISAHQAGIRNVVASSGTALTEAQLQALGRLTRNLKFCFDADQAGLNATKRAMHMYLGKEFTIKVIQLTGAKDPDELIQKDPDLFVQAVKNAQLFLDYYIERVFQDFVPGSVEHKKKVASEILPLLMYLQDPLEQDHYIKLLAERLSTDPGVLWDVLAKHSKQALNQRPSLPEEKVKVETFAPSQLEMQVVGGMAVYPDFRRKVLAEATVSDFEHPRLQELAGELMKSGIWGAQTAEDPLAKEAVFMVESQVEELEGGIEALVRELNKAFVLLKLKSIKRRQKFLHVAIKQAETAGQRPKALELSREFTLLASERLKYENQL